MTSSKSVLGVGVGLAAAGAAGALGFAIDRVVQARRTAANEDLDPSLTAIAQYTEEPDHERVVIAEDGVPLHVEIDEAHPVPDDDTSARPTIVFTHGYTQSLVAWVFQRRAFREAGYRLVLWDQRGHGKSEEGDESSYNTEQLGRDLAMVIAQEVPTGPIVLIGHSMGAMAMMAFAGQFPEVLHERVIGVGIVSSSSRDLGSVNYGLGKQIGSMVHRFGPAAMSSLATRQQLVDTTRSAGRDVESFLVHRYSFGGQVPLSVVRLTAEMIFQTKLGVIGAFIPGLMVHDQTAALAEFDGIETLVLHGTADRVTPKSHGDALVAAMPGAEYVVVEGAGHNVQLERPDVVNAELLALVERARRAIPPAKRGPRTIKRVSSANPRRRTARRTGRRVER